jgi:hypothetical protein
MLFNNCTLWIAILVFFKIQGVIDCTQLFILLALISTYSIFDNCCCNNNT